MPTIRHTDADGSTEDLTHVRDTVRYRENRQTTATATTTRTDANDRTLTVGVDDVEILDGGSTQFGGRLRDIQRNGDGTVDLKVASYQEDAKDAPPTPAKYSFTDASDAAIVRDAIAAIPTLSAGTIDSIEPGVDILFHHASRALQIRLMRDLSKGHVRYNADKTVDYTASIGSDKTGTTLSPANQNITQSTPRTKGGDNKKTHLRMIGAGGLSTDVVASSFSSGDRERWGRAEFKQVGEKTTLKTLGEQLLTELSNDWLEVRATLTGVSDPQLGDDFTVDYPEQDINTETLTIAELTTTRDQSGTHHEAVLSNRTFARSRAFERDKRRTADNATMGQTTATQNIPSVNIPMVELPGGEFIDQLFFLNPKHELYVWLVSSSPTSSDAAENENICVKIIENPGFSSEAELYSQCTSSYKSGSPLLAIDSKDFGRKIGVRLENTSTSTVAASAAVSYTAERVS